MESRQLLEHAANNFHRSLYAIEQDDFLNKLGTAIYRYDEASDKLIFLYKLHELIRIDLDEHVSTCTKPKPCRKEIEYSEQVFFIEQEIRRLNPDYDFVILRPNVDTKLLKENLVALSKFPQSGKLLQSALDKLNEGKYERNLLDDLRLCLETLLKSKLNNEKSLEGQIEFIGKHLKDSGVSSEVRNMFVKLIEYYSKYQNEYVKHNDAIKQSEIELMINLTSSMIYFIIEI
jgi:hypothetical protein